MQSDDLDAFGAYPEKKKGGAMMAGLWLAVLLSLGLSAYFAWEFASSKDVIQQLRADNANLEDQLRASREQAKRDEAALLASHRDELDRINGEWEQRVARLESEHEADMRRSAERMSQVVAQVVTDSGTTLDYIKDLQSKVRAGSRLQENEIQELTAVANGLAYLHKQYEKPIHEFKELETFLERQLQVPSSVPPEERARLFRRLFSRDYREQRQEQLESYYRDQGRREAMEVAKTKVEQAYAQAQSQMQTIGVSNQEFLDQLDAIIVGKGANREVMDSFFEVSEQILQIHQGIMDLQIDPATPADPIPPVPLRP